MANPISSTPFKAMEDEAYHSFREWPILLVYAPEGNWEMHLAAVAPTSAPPSKADAAAVAKKRCKMR